MARQLAALRGIAMTGGAHVSKTGPDAFGRGRCVGAPAAPGAPTRAQYPTRPVRMLVPFAPGSQTDILARWIGEKITEKSGQQVVVDNRPSAGGTIASQYVLEANADGHTLMMVSTGHAGNATHVFQAAVRHRQGFCRRHPRRERAQPAGGFADARARSR